MYKKTDADNAYEAFIKIFKSLYDKDYPIIQKRRKRKHNECLWVSKGLQYTCKKEKCTVRRLQKTEKPKR